MDLQQVVNVLKEMQLWRRGEPPYDGDTSKELPYTPKEFGQAIDVAIERLETELEFTKESYQRANYES